MERSPYFAETAAGAVILIAIQFLSLPLLAVGLVLLGVGRLAKRAPGSGSS